MKTTDFKQLIETCVRKVVREEMEYYFSKLQEQVGKNNSPINESLTSRLSNSSNLKKSTSRDTTASHKPKFNLQDKYRNMLTEMVFEQTDGFVDEDTKEADSILDTNKLHAISTSKKHKAVYDALTRDYRDIVKAMDNS